MRISQKVPNISKFTSTYQHQHGTYLALIPLMNFNMGALTWNPFFFAPRWFPGEYPIRFWPDPILILSYPIVSCLSNLSMNQSINHATNQLINSTNQSINKKQINSSINQSINRSIYLSTYLSIYLPIYLSICLSFFLSFAIIFYHALSCSIIFYHFRSVFQLM